MEALGVITHVDQPTYWVSLITYVQKANGELCLCLDPRDLNRAIHCNHHKMPTVKEVAHKFANSHYFTKLNAHHGYWSVVFDEESSFLTTFNSPFGEILLPVSSLWSGLFARHLPEEDGPVPQRVPWMYWNCHDITVHGCTEAEHDACLQNLIQVAHKYGVVFNPQKMHVKAPAINFFGCLYDASGVHPDPEKVDVVHALPAPTNVIELQRVPWHGDIPQPLHPWSVHSDCSSARKKMLTSPGMPATRLLFSKSSKPLSVTPPSDTSTHHCL